MDDAFRTEKAVYTPTDFILWQQNEMLEISPKFQRRPVWGTPARSLLIDTLLRGMTVPPLYFRMAQNKDKTKTIREVVDGQQRVRAVLEFISDDGYRLSRTLKGPWKGKTFSKLSDDEKKRIMYFSFSLEIFKGISDQQVLEVFSRLNMYSVPLNGQELRNGKYFGFFKQTSYDLAFAYLEFWRDHRVFSERQIARMLEVELTSELLIAGSQGMQDKKTSMDHYYDAWENDYPHQEQDTKRFNETMSTISTTFRGNDLSDSAFHRPPFFYTLYCVVFHHIFGLPGIQRPSSRRKMDADQRASLKEAVVKLSAIMTDSKDPASSVPKKYAAFVVATQRQTDNINPRKARFNTLFEEAF